MGRPFSFRLQAGGQDAIASGIFGEVQPTVGPAEHGVDGVRWLVRGDADAGGELNKDGVRGKAVRNRQLDVGNVDTHALGYDKGGFRGGVRQQCSELFPAPTAENIDATDGVLHALDYGKQGRIADGMTEPVVDRFEVVEIDHENRKRTAASSRGVQLFFAGTEESASVVEASERVGSGCIFQLDGEVGGRKPEETECQAKSYRDIQGEGCQREGTRQMPAREQTSGCAEAADDIAGSKQEQQRSAEKTGTAKLLPRCSREQPSSLTALGRDSETNYGNAERARGVAAYVEDVDGGHDCQQSDAEGRERMAVRGELQHGDVEEKEAEQETDVRGKNVEDGRRCAHNQQQSPKRACGDRSAEPAKAIQAAVGKAHDEQAEAPEAEHYGSENENGARIHSGSPLQSRP